MKDELDKSLRNALRPLDPPAGFEERVLERIAQEAEPSAAVLRWQPMRALRQHWYSGVALAASVTLAVVAVNQLQHDRRSREGAEARRQLIEALRVTSEKLDLAYEAVNESPSPDDAGV